MSRAAAKLWTTSAPLERDRLEAAPGGAFGGEQPPLPASATSYGDRRPRADVMAAGGLCDRLIAPTAGGAKLRRVGTGRELSDRGGWDAPG